MSYTTSCIGNKMNIAGGYRICQKIKSVAVHPAAQKKVVKDVPAVSRKVLQQI